MKMKTGDPDNRIPTTQKTQTGKEIEMACMRKVCGRNYTLSPGTGYRIIPISIDERAASFSNTLFAAACSRHHSTTIQGEPR
jgi:hypothetical protein